MKVGLYFGSFNPIHTGHLIIANIMVETTDLREVWFVVSPQNPFKKNQDLLHEFDRLDMVEAAVADNHKLKVTDIEFHMPRPSYTADTLAYLSDRHQEHEFSLIIGGDNLPSFPKWKNAKTILENYGLYVYPRPAMHNREPDPEILDHPHVKVIQAPSLDISATMIRRFIREGCSVRYLLPEPVADLIRIKKFYV